MVDEAELWRVIVDLANSVDSVGCRHHETPRELTKETELVKDLGLTGDDAFRFMEDFAARLNVDAGDFAALDYFEEESLWLLPWLGRKTKGVPITLGMLLLAAKDGAWNSVRLNQARQENSY